MQTHRHSIIFRNMGVSERTLDTFSDSAFKREDTIGYSLRGALYLRKGRRQGKPAVHLLMAECKSLSLVTRPTYGAELLGLETSIDHGFVVLIMLQEFLCGPLPTHDMKELRTHGNLLIQMIVHIDAKSVFESVRATVARLPVENSLVGHLLWVRDMLQIGVCRVDRWVDNRDMAVGGMTKRHSAA